MATVTLHATARSRPHRHVQAGYTDVRVSSWLFEDSFLLNREVGKSKSRSSTTACIARDRKPQETEGDCHESTDDRDNHLWPGAGRSAHLCHSVPGCAFCRGALLRPRPDPQRGSRGAVSTPAGC